MSVSWLALHTKLSNSFTFICIFDLRNTFYIQKLYYKLYIMDEDDLTVNGCYI